jgi:hypothetical protein
MKKTVLLLLSIFMLMSVFPAIGQSYQDESDPSSEEFQEWAKSLSEFVKDVRFNEKDMQDFLNQWDDFNSLGKEHGTDEEYIDFNSILNNTAYRSWAKSKGLDSEKWLKKSMRITAMMMKTSIEESKSEGHFDMTAQLAEIEKMREQMGEEMYQQMKQAMEAGAAAMQGLDESYKELPEPTASERILLVKYKEQLMNLE